MYGCEYFVTVKSALSTLQNSNFRVWWSLAYHYKLCKIYHFSLQCCSKPIRDNVVVNDKLILHLYGSVLVVVVAYGCPSLQPHQIFMWNTTEKAFIPGGLCQNGTWTTSCWLSMSRGKNTWSRAETMASAIIFTHFLYVCVLAHNDWIHFASCCLSLVSSTFLIKDQ